MSFAGTQQARIKSDIQKFGQLLTVTRRPGGTSPTTQTVYIMPTALGKREAQSLDLEGILNLAETDPHKFTAAGDVDLREGIDSVAYKGNRYRLVSVNETTLQGVRLYVKAYGVREGVSG